MRDNKAVPTCVRLRKALRHQEAKHLTATALASADSLIAKARRYDGPLDWNLLARENGYEVYKANAQVAGVTAYCGRLEVTGTLDEWIELFRTDNPIQAQEFQRRFGKCVQESVHLYTLAAPAKTRIDVAWKLYGNASWLTLQPSRKRDACLVECSREFVHEGRRGWVSSSTSVELACCPDFAISHGFVRLHNFGSGFVVVESAVRPGFLEVTYITHVDPGTGSFSLDWLTPQTNPYLNDMVAKRHTKSLLDIDVFLREIRLSRTPFIAAFHMTPKTSCRGCMHCTKRFNPLTKKVNCEKCGHVVCSSCIQPWHVVVHGLPRVVQVCNRCSYRSSQPAVPPAPAALVTDTFSSLILPMDVNTRDNGVLLTLRTGFDASQCLFDLSHQDDKCSDVLSTISSIPILSEKPRLPHDKEMMEIDANSDVVSTLSSIFDERQVLDAIFAERDIHLRVPQSQRSQLMPDKLGDSDLSTCSPTTPSLVDEAMHLSQVLTDKEKVWAHTEPLPWASRRRLQLQFQTSSELY